MNWSRLKKTIRELPVLSLELWFKRRRVLSYLRYCREGGSSSGTVDRIEFKELRRLAEMSQRHGGPIIEIGTLFGLSCQALCLGKADHQCVFAVDRFSWNPIGLPTWRHREMTRNNLAFFIEGGDVQLVEKEAREFYLNYHGAQPALVFIDAGHSYESVKNDINWAVGQDAFIICGDDFSFPGVEKAVRERFGSEFKIVGDMWIVFSSIKTD